MATTPNYSFSVYSSTDTDVRFLDFRVATAGSQSTSNFYVIDTVLKQHSDAIDSINATPSAFVVKGTYSSGSLYTASVANYPGYKNEQLIVLSLNQKNTGAVQININGTTNKDVMKYGSDGVLKAVDAGDFVANSPVLCLYDGTRFVVIGITSASSITVTGEAGDILQIADDGTIESSGKKAAQPNGIATLDENGNVVQVANMANSAAAVYSGEPVTVEYAGAQRIASITAYGENAQGGTTEAPVAITGVDSVFVGGNNLFSAKLVADKVVDVNRFTPYDKSNYYSTDTPIPVMKNTTYRLSSSGVLFMGNLHFKNKKGKTLSQIFKFDTFTVPNDADYIIFTVLEKSVTDPNAPIMLNVGTEPLPYEPYQGSVTQLPIPRPLRRVGDVKDKCVTRQDYESAEKLVVTYNVGFVELDGTEYMTLGNIDASQKVQQFNISNVLSSPKGTDAICSHISSASSVNEESISIYDNRLLVAVWLRDPLLEYGFVAGDSGTYIHAFKAYLAAQKAAGTPVQVAYQLAAPEVYATDPVDFDNTAGPLTVMTGGEVEVKMTDFVTDRTPAFLNKLDKTGDGSDVTVTFTEAATDTDIASGDKLSILFGKILKRFSTITSKFTTVDNSITQIESDISDITDGTTVVAQADKVTNALVIMSNSGTALVNYDGSATANMTLSPSNVGAEPAFTKNSAFNKNFGSSAGTVCQGNDGRLYDARRSSNITMSLSGTNLSISYS